MATGVEMLGQMSEDISLAGPVEGGNMVVKPNEAPVGAAALLSKQLRNQANKGVAGIYELPTPQENIPEFMKMAQANVKMQGDPMRGMGPREGLTPFDIANMSGAAEQAGILNFLGLQPEVTVPIRAKSHADAPSTQLAYITDAEKQMLLDANMHGSLDGEPNPGPGGVQSLDDWYTYTDKKGDTQVGGGSGEAVSAWESQGMPGSGTSDEGGYQSSEDFYAEQVAEDPDFGSYGDNQGLLGGQSITDKDFNIDEIKKQNEQKETKQTKELDEEKLQNAEEKLAELNAKKNLSDSEKKEKSSLTKLIDKIKTEGSKLIDSGLNLFGDSEEDKKNKKRIDELLKLAKGDKYNLSGSQRRELEKLQLNTSMAPAIVKAIGNFAAGIAGPEEDQFADDNYLNILESEILPKYGDNRDEAIEAFAKEYDDRIPLQNIGPDDQDFGTYDIAGSLKNLLDNKGDIKPGSDLEKRLKPVDYYRNNQPQTSGGLADMAQNLTMADIKNSGLKPVEQRRLSARLMEAREAASKDRGGNQNNRPRFMQETQEEVIETPDGVIDEEAQTMKYTSPRTGDKEQQVPLGRRFTTDPTKKVAQYTTTPRTQEDIYKYMTQGTTGEGITLEPFSEYQRRRRKAMGLDPLELWG